MDDIKPIKIENHTVGTGHPAYIVAEIGINHNGDMTLAKEEIAAAAEAGADSVKFQNYFVDDFISDRTLQYSYQTYNENGDLEDVTESQFDMFARCELTRENLEDLSEYCKKMKISMHSTPMSRRGLADLMHIGVPVIKNGSDCLSHIDLIRAMGETGLPTVLATGMSTVEDVSEAIRAFYETGNDKLIVLHCTSAYPTPDDEVNIRRVKTIRDTWGVLSGFSDHSWGISAAVLSIVYESCWIEKHYTLDKKLRGPDHRFSMDPAELKSLVQAVRAAEKQIGSPVLRPTKSETGARQNYRLSCVADENIEAGKVIDKKDIAYRRPGTGLRPGLAETLVGRKLKKSVPRGHIFDIHHDFE